MAHVGSEHNFHDCTRRAFNIVWTARAETHSFRPVGYYSSRTMAGSSKVGSTEARQRLHAISFELQRHLGSIYRCFRRRNPRRARSILVRQHEISPFDTDLHVPSLHHHKPDPYEL